MAEMLELELIGVPQSNYVWTCRIALGEKDVAYKFTPERPHSPAVDAIHPFGKIPVMRHSDVALCESKAIATYIDRQFPGKSLIPRSAAGGALCEQWISLINREIDPLLIREYLLGYFVGGRTGGQPDRGKIDAALPKMPRHFELLDRAVGKTGFLCGDNFSLADCFLVPILFYMSRQPESKAMMDERRNLNAYLANSLKRKSVAESVPPAPQG
jgi:glutathione S-transferase